MQRARERNPAEQEKQYNVYTMFDFGSQRKFVAEEMKQKLKLVTLWGKTIQLYTFASKKPKSWKLSAVEANLLLSKRTSKSIAGLHTASTYSHRGYRKEQIHQRTLRSRVANDLLIGKDYFFEFIQNQSQSLRIIMNFVSEG